MAIPGLFIEYLVNGSVAVIWLYPLLTSTGVWNFDPPLLPLYALVLYVVGMMIDFVAWNLTRGIKHILHRWISKDPSYASKYKRGASIERDVKFALYAPDLAKEASMRSSRDRVARGAFINSILITIFSVPVSYGIPLLIFTFVMWFSFESVSYKFELKAEQAIDQKNRLP
jgi:hypothetical protein